MIARAKDQFCEQLVIADIDLAETEKARLAQAKFGDS
jgi:predicted amidohydrolase